MGCQHFKAMVCPPSLKVKMSNVEFLYISTLEDEDALFSHNGIWLPSDVVSYPRIINSSTLFEVKPCNKLGCRVCLSCCCLLNTESNLFFNSRRNSCSMVASQQEKQLNNRIKSCDGLRSCIAVKCHWYICITETDVMGNTSISVGSYNQ